MIAPGEDSPASSTASNETLRRWTSVLRLASRAALGATPETSVTNLLELACRLSGAERAYLVSASSCRARSPRVEARFSLRDDGAEEASGTLINRSLAGRAPFASGDIINDRRIAGGDSVRALALRSVAFAPVEVGATFRGALIMDSRTSPHLPLPQLCELAEGLAGLIGLALAATGGGERESEAAAAADTHDLVGRSPALVELREWIGRVAPTALPVLIQGETGSGKELVARQLHRRSARRRGPFVAVNCAAFTETLLDAELFGAVRGAYTGAERDRPGLFRLAQGGTLFLDEAAEMPVSMQARLLRVLEERAVRPVGGERSVPVDVRVVAATHQDLARAAARGLFRLDLYHRIAVLEVRVPPLRERAEDLPLLVEALGPRLLREIGHGTPRLTPGAWEGFSSRA